MLRIVRALAALAVLAIASPASAQPPPWSLLQNDPDPFCNDPGVTVIQFAAPQVAEVRLEVWSPDTTQVVRTIVHGALPAGFHAVVWDGKDDAASLLPDARYPYSLTALSTSTGALLFGDMRVAEISCATPAVPDGWGRMKARYRDRE